MYLVWFMGATYWKNGKRKTITINNTAVVHGKKTDRWPGTVISEEKPLPTVSRLRPSTVCNDPSTARVKNSASSLVKVWGAADVGALVAQDARCARALDHNTATTIIIVIILTIVRYLLANANFIYERNYYASIRPPPPPPPPRPDGLITIWYIILLYIAFVRMIIIIIIIVIIIIVISPDTHNTSPPRAKVRFPCS